MLAVNAMTTVIVFGQVTVVESEKHFAIIKINQKIFLQRGDYMNDNIYALTVKDDTVPVLQADKSFFQFKNDTIAAWSVTAQVDKSNGIITTPPVYDIRLPFVFKTR
jgi:hypothetical protein